jgi:hypothetical protein
MPNWQLKLATNPSKNPSPLFIQGFDFENQRGWLGQNSNAGRLS